MYIEPDSTVILLAGCPINATYENTLWFNNAQSQENYFKSLAYRTFNRVSYQRATSGQITLQVNPYSVLNCNYLMFQNKNFSTKWFYAFITNVEYVNNETARITYEIDVMQTWLFDAKLRQCFVEREHSATDGVGDNIVDEPVDIGPIRCSAFEKYGLSGYSVVITIADADGEAGQGGTGMYSPLRYVVYSQFQQSQLDTYFNQIVENNLQDSVVGVTVMPTTFIADDGAISPYGSMAIDKPLTVGGYVPRNKKLLTSPYVSLSVDCLNDQKSYRWEWFTGTQAKFDVYCYVSPEVQISCTPDGYNGNAGPTEELVMRGYPQLPFIIDSYRAWLAQNSTSDMLSAASGIAGALGSLMMGNIGGAINQGIGVAQGVNSALIEQNRGDRARGVQSGGLDVSRGVKDFYFKFMCITPEYARIIDDFFDKYGYACMRNKIPSVTNRLHWNYVKTRGCSPSGAVPAEDMKKIASIYDSGITFWLDSDVGNYNRSNPVRG